MNRQTQRHSGWLDMTFSLGQLCRNIQHLLKKIIWSSNDWSIKINLFEDNNIVQLHCNPVCDPTVYVIWHISIFKVMSTMYFYWYVKKRTRTNFVTKVPHNSFPWHSYTQFTVLYFSTLKKWDNVPMMNLLKNKYLTCSLDT